MELIIVIALGIWVYGHGTKIEKLQKEIKQLKSGVVPQSEHNDVDTTMPVQSPSGVFADRPEVLPQTDSSEALKQYMASVPEESSGDRLLAWVQKDFMVKLGALLLLIGFGWFVSYAFANNWIGPVGRIVLGLGAGVGLMMVGVWRIQTHGHQGGIFTVLGSTTVLLTMYAARAIYDFFDIYSALFIMSLSVVFVAFMSVRYNRNVLALAGLVLAAVAPLLTAAPAPDVLGLFVYLTVIVLGSLWVVYLRGWSNVTLTALVIVFLHGFPYLSFGLSVPDKDIALLFAFFFSAIFFIANIVGLVCNETAENRQPHIMIGLGTGVYLITWITGAAPEEWQSLLYVVWMLVFSIGSFIVYRAVESRTPFYIYGGTSVVLLAAATAAELSGAILTIAFTFEVAALVMLTAHLVQNTRMAPRLSWLFILPIMLSLESIVSSSWYQSVLHPDFFVLVILGIALLCTGVFLAEKGYTEGVATVLMTIAGLYGLILVWLVLYALLDSELAVLFSTIIYGVIGRFMFIRGKQHGQKILKVGGGILIGFVVLYLMSVVMYMDVAIRIIAFFVIGTLFITTAFSRSRKTKEVTQPNDTNTL